MDSSKWKEFSPRILVVEVDHYKYSEECRESKITFYKCGNFYSPVSFADYLQV